MPSLLRFQDFPPKRTRAKQRNSPSTQLTLADGKWQPRLDLGRSTIEATPTFIAHFDSSHGGENAGRGKTTAVQWSKLRPLALQGEKLIRDVGTGSNDVATQAVRLDQIITNSRRSNRHKLRAADHQNFNSRRSRTLRTDVSGFRACGRVGGVTWKGVAGMRPFCPRYYSFEQQPRENDMAFGAFSFT